VSAAEYLAHARLVRAMADGTEAFAAAVARASSFDAAGLVAFARAHRLVAWIAPGLAVPSVSARVPDAVARLLADEVAVARTRTGEVVAETRELVDALEGVGIPTRVLKGLAFGVRFYGDVARRYQRDVDVLVPPADAGRAVDVVGRLGYVPEEARVGEGAVRRGFRRGQAAVDVHWNLRRRSRRRIDPARLFDRPVPVVVGDRTYATLDDEATLTFLLLAICGDLRRGGCRARHLLDLHLALHSVVPRLDLDGFLARRRAQGLEPPCLNVLAVFLGAWDVAEELPSVVAAVERRRRQVVVRDAAEALEVVARPADDPRNERWFQRAYPYDGFGAWARRLTVDLPFTVARALRPSFAVPRAPTPR
jgi:hypothetical protein